MEVKLNCPVIERLDHGHCGFVNATVAKLNGQEARLTLVYAHTSKLHRAALMFELVSGGKSEVSEHYPFAVDSAPGAVPSVERLFVGWPVSKVAPQISIDFLIAACHALKVPDVDAAKILFEAGMAHELKKANHLNREIVNALIRSNTRRDLGSKLPRQQRAARKVAVKEAWAAAEELKNALDERKNPSTGFGALAQRLLDLEVHFGSTLPEDKAA